MAYNFNLPEGPELEAERARMRADYGIKSDTGLTSSYFPQGNPYFERPGEDRRYMSPDVMGQRRDNDGHTFFSNPDKWNPQAQRYESGGRNWGNIMSLVVAGVLTMGMADLIMAGGTPAIVMSGAPASNIAAVESAVAATTGGTAAGVGGGAVTGASGATAAGTGINTAGLFAPTGMVGTTSSVAPTAGGLASGASAAGGGSVFSRFLGGAGKLFGGSKGEIIGNILGGAGRGISGATQASANNRGVALEAELEAERIRQTGKNDYERQLIARSQDDRDSLGDAWLRSNQAHRVLNNTGYTPASISQTPGSPASPIPMFDLGAGTRAPTEGQRSDAQGLYDQVQKRFSGSQLPPLQPHVPYQNDPKYMNPGGGERIGNWLGPALTIFGQQRPYIPPDTRRT